MPKDKRRVKNLWAYMAPAVWGPVVLTSSAASKAKVYSRASIVALRDMARKVGIGDCMSKPALITCLSVEKNVFLPDEVGYYTHEFLRYMAYALNVPAGHNGPKGSTSAHLRSALLKRYESSGADVAEPMMDMLQQLNVSRIDLEQAMCGKPPSSLLRLHEGIEKVLEKIRVDHGKWSRLSPGDRRTALAHLQVRMIKAEQAIRAYMDMLKQACPRRLANVCSDVPIELQTWLKSSIVQNRQVLCDVTVNGRPMMFNEGEVLLNGLQVYKAVSNGQRTWLAVGAPARHTPVAPTYSTKTPTASDAKTPPGTKPMTPSHPNPKATASAPGASDASRMMPSHPNPKATASAPGASDASRMMPSHPNPKIATAPASATPAHGAATDAPKKSAWGKTIKWATLVGVAAVAAGLGAHVGQGLQASGETGPSGQVCLRNGKCYAVTQPSASPSGPIIGSQVVMTPLAIDNIISRYDNMGLEASSIVEPSDVPIETLVAEAEKPPQITPEVEQAISNHIRSSPEILSAKPMLSTMSTALMLPTLNQWLPSQLSTTKALTFQQVPLDLCVITNGPSPSTTLVELLAPPSDDVVANMSHTDQSAMLLSFAADSLICQDQAIALRDVWKAVNANLDVFIMTMYNVTPLRINKVAVGQRMTNDTALWSLDMSETVARAIKEPEHGSEDGILVRVWDGVEWVEDVMGDVVTSGSELMASAIDTAEKLYDLVEYVHDAATAAVQYASTDILEPAIEIVIKRRIVTLLKATGVVTERIIEIAKSRRWSDDVFTRWDNDDAKDMQVATSFGKLPFRLNVTGPLLFEAQRSYGLVNAWQHGYMRNVSIDALQQAFKGSFVPNVTPSHLTPSDAFSRQLGPPPSVEAELKGFKCAQTMMAHGYSTCLQTMYNGVQFWRFQAYLPAEPNEHPLELQTIRNLILGSVNTFLQLMPGMQHTGNDYPPDYAPKIIQPFQGITDVPTALAVLNDSSRMAQLHQAVLRNTEFHGRDDGQEEVSLVLASKHNMYATAHMWVSDATLDKSVWPESRVELAIWRELASSVRPDFITELELVYLNQMRDRGTVQSGIREKAEAVRREQELEDDELQDIYAAATPQVTPTPLAPNAQLFGMPVAPNIAFPDTVSLRQAMLTPEHHAVEREMAFEQAQLMATQRRSQEAMEYNKEVKRRAELGEARAKRFR